MDTIIRCHVKNPQRLEGLQRELQSWFDKKMFELGDIYVIDDNSPMREEVKDLCKLAGVTEFIPAKGKPDTKNGLYYSLLANRDWSINEALFCVDDAVFGSGITERLKKYMVEEKIHIPNRGLVGLFACYEDLTREPNRIENTDLWQIPTNILYALVAHVFSINLRDILIWYWEKVLDGKIEYPSMCDDMWVKLVCRKYELKCYNTMKDYAQHEGGNNRTFGESSSNSQYQTKMFVGE